MRSLLIVRGDDEIALSRALASGADALVLALDAGEAEAARAIAARVLGAARPGEAGPVRIARVNALASGEIERDLDAAMAFAPVAILLPRCAGAAHVQALSVKLAVREARLGLADGATGIVAMIDSAQAALAAPGLRGASARLAAIAWDAGALGAEVGASSAASDAGGYRGALRLARETTLLAAASTRVPAIDTAGGSSAEAAVARDDGFSAKLADDPAQIAAINSVFARPRGP